MAITALRAGVSACKNPQFPPNANQTLLIDWNGLAAGVSAVANDVSPGGTGDANVAVGGVLTAAHTIGDYSVVADCTGGYKGPRMPTPAVSTNYSWVDGAGPICYEMLFELTSIVGGSQGGRLFETRVPSVAIGILLSQNPDATISLVGWGSGAVRVNLASTKTLSINTPYHVVAQRYADLRTWNVWVAEIGQPAQLFISGKQTGAGSDSSSYTFDMMHTRYNSSRYSEGYCAACRITQGFVRYKPAGGFIGLSNLNG